MKAKIKSSIRVKRKHLLISGSRAEIEKIILDYIGILGWARAAPVFLREGDGMSILSVSNKELDNVRASFEMADSDVRVLKVSGTLKGLEKR